MPPVDGPDAPGLAACRFAVAFFDALAGAGVQHVCVSPGSRSTPLVLAAAAVSRHRERASGALADAPPQSGVCAAAAGTLHLHVHLDERSAGFFALGMARALRAPVALVCTSGTAAANYLPAVVEAFHAGVPLLVLSADRPPELRDRGAGQTIDQVRLYGPAVRWFHEVPVPEAGGPAPRLARSLAMRAVREALGRPGGPVHLNWPLREPLAPAQAPLPVADWIREEAQSGAATDGDLAALRRDPQPRDEEVEALAALVRHVERGVICAGPDDLEPAAAAAIASLARAAGWPLLADPASGLRAGAHCEDAPVLARADGLLRVPEFAAACAPQAVLRIGRAPTSKAQRLWLEARPPAALWLVDPDRAWHDPAGLATQWLDVDPGALCGAAARRLAAEGRSRRESGWLRTWLDAEAGAERVLARELDAPGAAPLLSPLIVRTLARALPDDVWLYLSNSMAVRDADAFWPLERRARRVLANRGASGIDGVSSSALGASAASGRRVCLLTGDLAFLHDVGGLLAASRQAIDATFVVVDDDGGGIFSYLPVAAHGEAVDFEALFRTPHGRDLAHAAALAGAAHVRVRDALAFEKALGESFDRPGLSIVEVPVDRDANVALHGALGESIAREIRGGLAVAPTPEGGAR